MLQEEIDQPPLVDCDQAGLILGPAGGVLAVFPGGIDDCIGIECGSGCQLNAVAEHCKGHKDNYDRRIRVQHIYENQAYCSQQICSNHRCTARKPAGHIAEQIGTDCCRDTRAEQIYRLKAFVTGSVSEVVYRRSGDDEVHAPFCEVGNDKYNKSGILEKGDKHVFDSYFVPFSYFRTFDFNFLVAVSHLEVSVVGGGHEQTKAEDCCCKLVVLANNSPQKGCKGKSEI